MASQHSSIATRQKRDEAPQVFLRIVFPDYNAIGPYGTAFLEAIQECASISAAARAKGLTYRQAWLVARTLNTIFREPLIATRQGRGGGARLTPLGRRVISLFRDAEKKASAVLHSHTDAFNELRKRQKARQR